MRPGQARFCLVGLVYECAVTSAGRISSSQGGAYSDGVSEAAIWLGEGCDVETRAPDAKRMRWGDWDGSDRTEVVFSRWLHAALLDWPDAFRLLIA